MVKLTIVPQKVRDSEDAAFSSKSLGFPQPGCNMKAEALVPDYKVLPFS